MPQQRPSATETATARRRRRSGGAFAHALLHVHVDVSPALEPPLPRLWRRVGDLPAVDQHARAVQPQPLSLVPPLAVAKAAVARRSPSST